MKPASIKHLARTLHDSGLARLDWYADGAVSLRLLPDGAAWLDAHEVMP
jgi:hypothetical protein